MRNNKFNTTELPRIAVLMSTYNGEKYLKEQIDSIISQEDVGVTLYIRDDGSSDRTVRICERYAETYNNINFTEGKQNLNYGKSFLTLLTTADESDYFAFADQDDFWKPRKLIEAIRYLQKNARSENDLYVSALDIVDENLVHRKYKTYEKRKISMGSFLSRTSFAGCTMVFTNHFREAIKPLIGTLISDFKYNYGHDAWMLLLCTGMGASVVVDNRAFIKYRRHSDTITNVSGGVGKRLSNEWKAFNNKDDIRRSVTSFLHVNCRTILDDNAINLCKSVMEYRNSLMKQFRLSISPQIKTGILLIDIKSTAAVLLKKY